MSATQRSATRCNCSVKVSSHGKNETLDECIYRDRQLRVGSVLGFIFMSCKMFENTKLLSCIVTGFSSIIFVSQLQLAKGEDCPVPTGKLGPRLAVVVTQHYCSFSNLTSPPTDECRTVALHRSRLLRGERHHLPFDIEATLWGGEICFGYETKDIINREDRTSRRCLNKCFNATAETTNTTRFIHSIWMNCAKVNESTSCSSAIHYSKITIQKATFPRRIAHHADCFPARDKTYSKKGNQESVRVKIQDCINVTWSYWKKSERCDDLEVMETKSTYHTKNLSITTENMNVKELVMKKADHVAIFQILPVRGRISTYFNGEDFCAGVWSNFLICTSACVSYRSGTPIMLKYYHVHDYQIIVKTLKFFVSHSAAASINASIKILLLLIAILLPKLL